MAGEIKQPYVGVSGVISPTVEAALETTAQECGLFGKGRLLALGVKAVHKTQFLDIENKYGPEWYPVGEESFRGALRHTNQSANTVGVAQAYFDVEYVHDSSYREAFLRKIVDRGSPWLQSIQFDMLPWHNDGQMWNFLETVKQGGVKVFLQAHGEAMNSLGPKDTVRLLGSYAHLLDYVLFDSSHGTGKRLDVDQLTPFIAEAHDTLDLSETGVAIAGGLNSENIRHDLPQLLAEYPNISWDAEGQLHPINHDGKRPLDLEVAKKYLQASSQVLIDT